MDASGLWSFVHSINFQTRQIPATNIHFSCEKSLVMCWSRFQKKTFFFGLRSCYHRQANWKKLNLLLKNTLKLEGYDHSHCQYITFWVIYIFQSGWDNVVEIWEFNATSRAYSRPISRLTIERCPLLQKLYKALFRCKTLVP